MDNNVKKLTLSKDSTIKDAMDCINKSGKRVALVVDKKGRLIGLVTDGDIRRHILKSKSIEGPVKEILNLRPIVGKVGMTKDKILAIMEKNEIITLPILDKKGILKDLVLMQDLVKISLSSPDITSKELNAIKEVLVSSTLSIGPQVEKFEKLFAQYIGVKYAIAVNSGTSALHLCVRALGIKDGDEIITSPFSFIASANCALFERANPVFADIDKKTLCLDYSLIEKKITKRTKAILPVHIFGHPCQLDKIMVIAKKYNLAVIEDACEALGSEFNGKKVGSFGQVGVFAFYPNKQITTSEGGMIVTNSKKIADICRAMRNQGRTNNRWLSHEILGFNYRLGELNAALGVVQMQRVEEILKKRKMVAEYYNKRLKSIKGVSIPYISKDVKISWFVYVIRLDGNYFSRKDRDKVIKEMTENGIYCRDYFPPIHLEPLYVNMFGYKKGDYPITESVSDTTIALPFYNNLSQEKVDIICQTLESVLIKVKKNRE